MSEQAPTVLSLPDYNPIICPGCDRKTEVQWLCYCHSPICWLCHDDGAHHWREIEKRETA